MSNPTREAIAQTALQIAVGYAGAGVHEEGGNNRGDQVEFFQRLFGGAPGESWCAYFVSTCMVKAFARLAGKPEDRASLPACVQPCLAVMPAGGYCPHIWGIAGARGLTRAATFNPAAGDLVLFDFLKQGQPHHIGFVRVANLGGSLLTIEGNTSSGIAGNQSDGDGVFGRKRDRSDVFGFVSFA